MTKLLVTGGAGFIGRHFIEYMHAKYPNYHIINVDSLTYASRYNQSFAQDKNSREEKGSSYTFVKADIRDIEQMDVIFARFNPQYVVNFAAESHVDRSLLNPTLFFDTNVKGTHVLLEMIRKHWGQKKQNKQRKFLQISTDEVYGSAEEGSVFTEDSPLAPNTPYAASKAAADCFVRAYGRTYRIPFNITRSSNNYGPYQYPEKLIPRMISCAKQNKRLTIYGDGLQMRDWLYVEDHCQALDFVLQKAESGEIYNIGARNVQQNIHIVKFILHFLGKPQSLIQYVQDRLSHDRRYAINPGKMFRDFKWQSTITFKEGMERTLNWYLANPDWISE